MNIFGINSGRIFINGTEYSGKNVSIVNGVVTIDGKRQDCEFQSKQIVIQIYGDVGSVQSESGDITVTGKVHGDVKSASGDIECGDVGGGVKTMSGDVKCGAVGGGIQTLSGDVWHR